MAVKADKLGPGKLTFTPDEGGAAREFAGQCTKLTYKPEYKTEDPTPMLDGSEYLEPGELTGSLEGEIMQDYGTDSLPKWCFDHMGEDVKKSNSTSFSFPTVGKPTLEEAADPTVNPAG